MSDKVYRLSIVAADVSTQEIIIAMLSMHDISAIEQTDDQVIIYDERAEVLESAREAISAVISADQIQLKEIQNKNWNEEWERSFQPIEVGDFCGVRASFHAELDTQYDIIINPELAFGTGHHETTYMMIDQMSRMDLRGQRVFDFGCGTAILAILSKMMDSSYTLAIDYDEHSIKCAHDCLQLNGIDSIELRMATIDQVMESHFDIILANINRNVLIDSVKDVYDRQVEGGLLLLSGLLRSDEAVITELYTSIGYTKRNVCYRGEWISMLMERRLID